MSYISDCLEHNTIYDIDDYVSEWHDGESNMDLSEFLGLTREEYTAWVKDDNAIYGIIQKYKIAYRKEKIKNLI